MTSELFTPSVPLTPASTLALAPEQFARLRDMLANFSGVYLDETRQRVLESGLERRLQATGSDLATYERRLNTGSGELNRLAELVLNHETVFFRNQPHMNVLRDVLLPEMMRRKPAGTPIRIWSAGCATGEEAYSLALLALETPGCVADIWATDLSEPAIQKAREGVYRGRTLQNVPDHMLARYFQPFGDAMRVGPEARALIRFETLNLLQPWPARAQNVDIVFCQNVMIYFQIETSRRMIANFFECLNDGGLLFLGFSENLWNIFDQFRMREINGAYVYYKGAQDAPPPGISSPTPAARASSTRRAMPPSAPTTTNRSARVTNGHAPVFNDHEAATQADATALLAGREFIAQGDFEQAISVLRQVSSRGASAAQAHMLMARAYAARGELDAARANARAAVALEPLNDEAYLLLGLIACRQQQWAEAIQQLERARYINAEAALISFHLAEVYRQTGRQRKAVREYRNTLRKLSKHPPDAVLDGVAAGWVRDTCERQITCLQPPA